MSSKKIMKPSIPYDVYCAAGTNAQARPRDLIAETPVRIWIENRPFTTLLCTPGDQEALAAGYCLSEGLIGGPQDLAAVQTQQGGTAVHVLLARECRDAFLRRFASSGGGPVPDFKLDGVAPPAGGPRLDPRSLRGLIESLDALQPLRAATRAAHAAALYDQQLSLLAVAEDVGRHNALDRAVGKLLLGGGFDRIRVLVLSSRISFEMVNKAVRAGVAVLAAVSRPTAMAVDLARRMNMTLVNPQGADGLCVYCGGQRLGLACG